MRRWSVVSRSSSWASPMLKTRLRFCADSKSVTRPTTRAAAIVAAAALSHRYISDRFLPDKAIDLVDEAAASLAIQIGSVPMEIDQLERRIMSLEIEAPALKRETDRNSKERLEAVMRELAALKEEATGLRARWQTEREAITRLTEVKKKIEGLRFE